MSVRCLGYVGVEASDLLAWRAFASEQLRVDVRSDGGSVRLRMDDRHARIWLHKGPADDVCYVGWDVGGPSELDAVAERLRRYDLDVRAGTAEEASARGVLDLIVTEDPDGLRLELVCGHLTEAPSTFTPGRLHAGFVTGDLGMGHVVLKVSDIDAALAFYTAVLGFRITDIVRFAPSTGRTGQVAFLHCNGRHHSLALVETTGRRLRHLMIEHRGLDDLGVGYEAATAGGVLTRTLGLHTNDRALSYYVRTPSGFEVEVGWGARLVANDESTGHFERTSFWGHERL